MIATVSRSGRGEWGVGSGAVPFSVACASAISRYVPTSMSSEAATRCVLLACLTPHSPLPTPDSSLPAQLPALALCLDRRCDDHLRVVHISQRCRATHAHARPQGADQVLRAVGQAGRTEQDVFEAAADAYFDARAARQSPSGDRARAPRRLARTASRS